MPKLGIKSGLRRRFPPEALNVLRWPSNGDSPDTAFVALQFLNPHSNGLPIWGPGNAGTTWIWEYTPRQQNGYYVTFWWGNTGINDVSTTFLWSGGTSNTYYGAHPYGGGSSHDWELAGMGTANGGDTTDTLAGGPLAVVNDVKYTQALRMTHNGGGSPTKTGRFYIALPSLANGNIITATSPAGWGDVNPPSPAITFGGSPWAQTNERMSGDLGRLKIFDKVLSESDTAAEAADMSGLVTVDGAAHIWYGKTNWRTVDDLTCDYGTGRAFAWVEATKASLVAA